MKEKKTVGLSIQYPIQIQHILQTGKKKRPEKCHYWAIHIPVQTEQPFKELTGV
jgi:hypothetical protein